MSWNIITVNGDDYDNENDDHNDDHNDDDDDYDKYDENYDGSPSYLSRAAQMIFILTFPAAREDYWLL